MPLLISCNLWLKTKMGGDTFKNIIKSVSPIDGGKGFSYY